MTTPLFGITDYLTYIIGVIAVILLPGPNSMYCLYVGSKQGVRKGYQAILAILLGDTVLMLATVLGAATLLRTNASLFMVFKTLGGLYLAYLGIQLLIAAVKSVLNAQISEDTQPIKIQKNENVFLKAFTLGISNPKAILFFLSFFLQFVDPNYSNPALSFLVLGLILQLVSFTYLSILVFVGIRLVSFFKGKPFLEAFGNSFVGLLFLSFALSLWIAERP